MPAEPDPPPRPLHGLRVLDLATGPLAAIGRLLAELGADVIRAESSGGAVDRTQAPAIAGVGLDFATQNLGKRAVALDPATQSGQATLHRLLAGADVLIEHSCLNPADLAARFPALIILSIHPFNPTGRHAAWQATDPVLHALSGELSRSGIPGRPPLLPPGALATACAAVQAVYVILLAVLNRTRTGLGDQLDFSLLEAAGQALDPGFGIAGSASLGVAASDLPRGRAEARHQYPIIPCADGHVRICVLAPRQWRGLFEWMGRPPQFADPRYESLQVRFTSAELIPAIAAFFASQTRAALEAAGQRHGVPTAALLTLPEALATDHIAARACLRPIPIAPGHTIPVIDGVLEIDGQRMGAPGPLPALQDQIDWHEARLAPPTPQPDPGRPLAGLRVLDFGVIVVGAEQGRLLADQGAEVIKIESAAFPDGARQSKAGGKIAPTFAAGHFNKQSLGLNLRDPQGRALLLRLAAQSDIVLSNFKPGTLDSLGLGAATLRGLNPRLILVESAAFGPTGPWSTRLGYGPLVRASSGLTDQWRYANDPEGFSDALTVYPDHVAARIGAIGALALLIRRARTGAGGTVHIAQNEVMLSHMATAIARGGDPLPEPDAPWGVFPCAGDDEWCVVTLRGDHDWPLLCTAIDRPDLAADPALAHPAGRIAARPRIHAALQAWLATRSPSQAMETLQAAGIPAGAMLRVADLPGFEIFAARGSYRQVTHPHLSRPFFRDAAPVRSQRLPPPPDAPAPLLGEHTIAIATHQLGLTKAEIAALLQAGVLEGTEA
jgi:crotonobetainyl-CoA:carnitine CoA-transferase CaiB-like acyl-CoA transferase